MDFLPVYSSSFDLCVGRTNANYLAGYEMDRVGMRERIENTSKESLTAKTEKNNPTFTKSDLLEGRITHEKAPDDLDDAYDSTVSESD